MSLQCPTAQIDIQSPLYTNRLQKHVDLWKDFENNAPNCCAKVIAQKNFGLVLHEEITVKGAKEDLSFYITLSLPVQPPSGMCTCTYQYYYTTITTDVTGPGVTQAVSTPYERTHDQGKFLGPYW